MLKYIVNLAFLCSLLLSCSTSQKINTLRPEPDDASPLIYENSPSFINLPINIKLKDIENKTNLLLNGLIYDDNNIQDDDIEIKIWKLAPITIKNANATSKEKIETVLPLKAIVKYRIGTKTMGVELYDTREFNLSGIVTLISEVSLTNWQLKTKTELKSLEWSDAPTMSLIGKNVPITYLINPAIKLFKSKIEKKIDDAISKSMDFKPNVLEALEVICNPFRMNDNYESWLRIIPIEIYSTTAKLKKDSFELQMGMKCNMETLIGARPESKIDINKITLKPVIKVQNQIKANVVAVSSYYDASRIITKNFRGQEFGSGGKKITVQNVSIWHKDGKMVIALEVLGSVNGVLYLSGLPKYDDEKKEIYFDELEYVLDTKNKLMRTANWLAQAIILSKIKQNCRYSIQTNLNDGKRTIMSFLDNYSPLPGIFVNGKIEEFKFKKIELTNNAIIALVTVNGEINISINGLK
ncbi:DUF4403 family protein [Flavobacterium sp. W22_SRS_FP1]|uniref:DUF4403 family protein n=1 Tax=Flavobacterium sp. W22_SRS_FP1 TaxID=3240276 RepID=UPI003F91158A